MTNLKKLEIGGGILLILFVLYVFVDTYGLFESKGTMLVNNTLATWQIKINRHDVKTTKEFTIDELNWDNAGYAKDGKLVPGSEGYFDIVIDPTNTQVAVRYDITYDLSKIDNQELQLKQIDELVHHRLVRTGEFTYTGVIRLEEITNSEINTVRVVLQWNHKEENNAKDTELSNQPNSTIEIPIYVHLSQYLGEEIKAYTG